MSSEIKRTGCDPRLCQCSQQQVGGIARRIRPLRVRILHEIRTVGQGQVIAIQPRLFERAEALQRQCTSDPRILRPVEFPDDRAGAVYAFKRGNGAGETQTAG